MKRLSPSLLALALALLPALPACSNSSSGGDQPAGEEGAAGAAGGAGAAGSSGSSGGSGAGGSGEAVPQGIVLTDGPLPAGAKCDPSGHWQITWIPATDTIGASFCAEPQAHDLDVVAGAGGGLRAVYPGIETAMLTGDGCEITLAASQAMNDDSHGAWVEKVQLDLIIDGDMATGTYVAMNSGSCTKSETGPATATRQK